MEKECDEGYKVGFYDGYATGIEEERERCIKAACEWLLNNFEGGGYVQPHQLEEFCKAMAMEIDE